MTTGPQTFTDVYGDILTISPRDSGGAHLDPGRGNTNDVLHFDTATLQAIRAHLDDLITNLEPR